MKTKIFLFGIALAGQFFLAGNFLFAQNEVRNHRLYGGLSASYAHIFHIANGSVDFPFQTVSNSPFFGKNFSDFENGSFLGGASLEYFLDEDLDYSLTGRILFQTISNSEQKFSSNVPFAFPSVNGDTLRNTTMRGTFNYNSLNFELLAGRKIFSPLYFSAGLGVMIPTQADYTQLFEVSAPDTVAGSLQELVSMGVIKDFRDNRTLIVARETKFLVQYYAKFGFQYQLSSGNYQLAPHIYYSIGLNDIFTENNSVPFIRMNSIIAGIDFRYGL